MPREQQLLLVQLTPPTRLELHPGTRDRPPQRLPVPTPALSPPARTLMARAAPQGSEAAQPARARAQPRLQAPRLLSAPRRQQAPGPQVPPRWRRAHRQPPALVSPALAQVRSPLQVPKEHPPRRGRPRLQAPRLQSAPRRQHAPGSQVPPRWRLAHRQPPALVSSALALVRCPLQVPKEHPPRRRRPPLERALVSAPGRYIPVTWILRRPCWNPLAQTQMCHPAVSSPCASRGVR
mmetsp:Transcript_34774/g.110344  ORF Transcript_34774/g.110344 Transcript_34774/m.110344 type:complete len:236 (-) Transcript_34774:236-943(-)